MPAAIGKLERTTRLLIATRGIRSIGQGALVVDFALYLDALGWSPVGISLVLSGALLFGAALTLMVGPLSDRVGRRSFLLAYEAVQLLVSLAALFSSRPWLLGPAAVLGGFGRGANGAAGPFAPVEQAWLAQNLPLAHRGSVYSLNAACGFLGMAAGAMLAALPAALGALLPGPLAYRPLFAIAALGSLICVLLLLGARDEESRSARPPVAAAPEDAATVRRENALILRLLLANALNGIGIGLTGPLVSFWFAVRFHQGPVLIGPMMAAAFVLTGLASLGTGRLTRLIGLVRAIVVMRLVGLVLLLALAFAPSFGIAAALYILRSIFNRGTAGARSALSVSIVRPSRRGLAASAANVSLQIPRAVGPVFAGLMYQDGALGLPFLIGAVFQAGYLYVYERSFRKWERGGA